MSENRELDQEQLDQVRGGLLDGGRAPRHFDKNVSGGSSGTPEERPQGGSGGVDIDPQEK